MYKLKELSEELINEELYEMYQDIPNGDNEQTNEAYGLSKDKFKEYIIKQINRKFNDITYDDTPTITYIMYVNNIPIGFICIRTKIDDNWKKWSGNFYYQVRVSQRRKGYATQMLAMALNILKKLNYNEVYGQSSKGNIGSSKVIENNGGIFLYEENGTKYYKIILDSIYLKVPTKEELHYRQKWMIDKDTMNYNAGYNLDIEGYNKRLGTILKSDEEMLEWYDKWINVKDRYYAYIYLKDIDTPIGEVYYYLDKDNKYHMGILIISKYRGLGYSYSVLKELQRVAFIDNNISELIDVIPINRVSAIKTFIKAGFIETDNISYEKCFNENIKCQELLITRDMYLDI